MLENISIYCKNTSRFYEVPIGSSLLDIYKIVGEPLNHTVLSAQVNNRTEDLTFCCWQPKDIEFVDYTSPAGMRTYIRSLCHIFSKAVYDVLPDAILRLEHSVSKGYYCFLNVHNRKVNAAEVENIKKRMQEIIDANQPFHRKIVHTADAAEMFRQRGMMDKVRLIETTGMLYTTYYELLIPMEYSFVYHNGKIRKILHLLCIRKRCLLYIKNTSGFWKPWVWTMWEI